MTKRIQTLRPRPDLADPAPSDDLLTQAREQGFDQDAVQKWAVPVLLVVLAGLTIWIGYTVTVFVNQELNPGSDLMPIVVAQASGIDADRANQLESIYTNQGDLPDRLVQWAKLARAEDLTLASLSGLVGSTDSAGYGEAQERLKEAVTLFDELLAGGGDKTIEHRALMSKGLALEGLAQPQAALTVYGRLAEEDAGGPLGQQARRRAEYLGVNDHPIEHPNDFRVKPSILAFYEQWKKPANLPPLEGSLPGLKLEGWPVGGDTMPTSTGAGGSNPAGSMGGAGGPGGMLPGSSPLSVPEAREPLQPGLELPAAAPTPEPGAKASGTTPTADTPEADAPAEASSKDELPSATPAAESTEAESADGKAADATPSDAGK